MNQTELLVWGRKENETRKREIAETRNTGGLDSARAAASRRKAVGLSAGQAALAIQAAQREAKGLPPWK